MLFNRDLSWMQFNARVLNEALDSRTPLLERVRFLQIFTTNLDEFFMKRVGRLKRQAALGLVSMSGEITEPSELLVEIRNQILPLLKLRTQCWGEQVLPLMNSKGIMILQWNDLRSDEKRFMEEYFDRNLFPVLTPLSVGPGHPFPFISNLSTSLGVLLRDPQSSTQDLPPSESEMLYARVKIPNSFPYWLRLPSSPAEERFISIQSVVSQFIGKLFHKMEILGQITFRITRSAEIEMEEDEAEDLLEMIAEELRERRFAEIVRLEYGPSSNIHLKRFLKSELELVDTEIYENDSDIDFSQMQAIIEIPRKDLKYRSWTPVVPDILKNEDKSIFSMIRESDIMIQHPYESFHQSVERFIQAAVSDSKVLAIKMTLYRTGPDSPFVPLLIRAAESGKQVVCLVELKARFDEERNIYLARELEKAGVHVVYGIVGLKTHCKIALIVRQEDSQVQSYVHIGTGNYNSITARLYTDIGIFTSKPEIIEDIVQLFHFLTGRSLQRDYKKILVSPFFMKRQFLDLIHFEKAEALEKKPARIIAKMNSLEDGDIIQALYEASQAGVQIDLIVRGFCCLVPQVPGLSENIRVISIIGRFLEHSRIYFFQHGAANILQGAYYIGSADWMTRNLEYRVEVVTPVEDLGLRNRLQQILQSALQDHRQAWELDSHGIYHQRHPPADYPSDGLQETQMKYYESLAHRSKRANL